jgi:hypothetical protein
MPSVKDHMLKKKISKLYRKSNMSKRETTKVLQTQNRLRRAQQGVDTWDEATNLVKQSEEFLSAVSNDVDQLTAIPDSAKQHMNSDFFAAVHALTEDINVYTARVKRIKSEIPQAVGYVEPDQKPLYFKVRDDIDGVGTDILTNVSSQLSSLQNLINAGNDTAAIANVAEIDNTTPKVNENDE